jgi:hypothetical protein
VLAGAGVYGVTGEFLQRLYATYLLYEHFVIKTKTLHRQRNYLNSNLAINVITIAGDFDAPTAHLARVLWLATTIIEQ